MDHVKKIAVCCGDDPDICLADLIAAQPLKFSGLQDLQQLGRYFQRKLADFVKKDGPLIFVNNAIYGMTGGQMAPTTLIGQRATTAPLGRTVEQAGMPMRVAEMLSTLDGCVYAERVCVTDIPHLNKAKKALKKAFEKQMAGEGFTFGEVLAACPTNWGMETLEANKWLMENMAAYYPLGVIKEVQ